MTVALVAANNRSPPSFRRAGNVLRRACAPPFRPSNFSSAARGVGKKNRSFPGPNPAVENFFFRRRQSNFFPPSLGPRAAGDFSLPSRPLRACYLLKTRPPRKTRRSRSLSKRIRPIPRLVFDSTGEGGEFHRSSGGLACGTERCVCARGAQCRRRRRRRPNKAAPPTSSAAVAYILARADIVFRRPPLPRTSHRQCPISYAFLTYPIFRVWLFRVFYVPPPPRVYASFSTVVILVDL